MLDVHFNFILKEKKKRIYEPLRFPKRYNASFMHLNVRFIFLHLKVISILQNTYILRLYVSIFYTIKIKKFSILHLLL